MRAALVILFFLSACIGNAGGESLARQLTGRTVVFGQKGDSRETAMWQSWGADGTTRTGGPSIFHTKSGHWKIDQGRYCEIFGLSTEWGCWQVTVSSDGKNIRFWEIPDSVGDALIFHKDLAGFFTI